MNFLGLIKAKDNESNTPLLKEHLLSVLEQLGQLYKYIETNEATFTYEPIANKEQRLKLFKLLTKALFLHDVGKINYEFQKKIYDKDIRNDPSEERKWDELKCKLPKNKKKVRHEILSIFWSIALLDNNEESKKIRTAILFHHYNEFWAEQTPDLMEIIGNYPHEAKAYLNLLKRDDLQVIICTLLDFLKQNLTDYSFITESLSEIKIDFSPIARLIESLENHNNDLSSYAEFYEVQDKSNYEFLVILGILRRCDYSGSGDVKIENEANVSGFILNLWEKIKEDFKQRGVTEFWQEAVLSKETSKNTVLVAPTGSGKTEFALIWAKQQGRKLIYTLPLRVALNDIYKRFTKDKSNKIGLLHSTAFIEYLKNKQSSNEDSPIDAQITSAKLFSEPLLLSTPDQVFLTCLNFYGSDKLVGIYPLSSIVIDEIQTYDPEMASIIIKTLEIINKLNGNVLIITATFPPYFKKFLDEYGYKTIDLKEEIGNTPELKSKVKNYERKRHKVELREKSFVEINEEKKAIPDEVVIKEIVNHSNKNVLIIVNTVKKAIAVYQKILSELKKEPNEELKKQRLDKLYLLHSRLLEKEKRLRVGSDEELESIKGRLKKEEKGIILVATQIVEASVDIDFDVLYTEISTIDSQIQRWGRVYRNRKEDYDENSPNIIIFTELDKHTNAIYDKDVTTVTIKEIESLTTIKENKLTNILGYEEERKLIQNVFTKNNVKDKTLQAKYEEEIDKNINNLQFFTVEKKSEAQRLFRKIAGQAAVFPQVMLQENDESEEGKIMTSFAKLLRDESNYELSWRQLIEKMNLFEIEVLNDKEKMNKLKWRIKEILYDYSINIPIYTLDKYRSAFSYGQFKGFLVAKIKLENAEIVRELGVDSLWEKSPDDIYLDEFDDRNI